jgi:hypothetical protein
MPEPSKESPSRWLPWLALAAVVAAISLQKIRTFDYWWHLRSGQLIAETGSVPRFDVFSFTAEGSRWIDIHWLHQLGLHGLYSLGGHGAVVWGKFLLVAALVVVLGRIGYRAERALVSVVPLALMLLVAGDRFMPRPELPSFVLLAGVLALVDRFERRGDRSIWGVVLLQLVWVNLHGLFALGLAVCGIHLVAGLLWPRVRGEAVDVPRVKELAGVTCVATLASLCNPNFLDAALYPLTQLGMVAVPELRVAHQSMELRTLVAAWSELTGLAKGLTLASISLPAAAMAANHRRVRGSDLLLFGAFLFLGFASQRNLALFAVVGVPITVRNLNAFLDARPEVVSVLLGRASHALAVLLLLVVAGDLARGSFFFRLGVFREPGVGVMEMLYPIGAADWIDAHRPKGPLCHHSADGGYLIWRLYPDYRVMLDGRLEVYGPEKVNELGYEGVSAFQKLDRKLRCGVVLVHYGEFHAGMLGALQRSPGFKLAFVDEVAAVFVRAIDNPRVGVVDVDAPDLFPPFAAEPSLLDAYARQTRSRFYAGLGDQHRFHELMSEAAELYPEAFAPEP